MGKEKVQARSVVEDHLRRYAFIITPRMWSKYEVCLIMCILLDSSLVYQQINQKTGLPSTEAYQNRLVVYVFLFVFDFHATQGHGMLATKGSADSLGPSQKI
jgi:hypothetical protein